VKSRAALSRAIFATPRPAAKALQQSETHSTASQPFQFPTTRLAGIDLGIASAHTVRPRRRGHVSNPRKTRAIAEAKVKTDKVDARILAQLVAADFLPSTWFADDRPPWPPEERADRLSPRCSL
jgi:hypothetical protein